MARFGCLLEIISMVALFMLVVLPVIPFFEESEFFDNLLKPVLCPDGEIHREQHQYTDREGTSYSMTVTCEDERGRETDVTGNWIGIGVASFLIPFLIGLFMVIFGVNRSVRGMVGTVPSVAGYNPATTSMDGFSSFGSSVSVGNKTLSQKLQELEDARRQGLISESEYENKRQDILNG